MPAGRPTIYSDEIVDEICRRIALGDCLAKICDDPDLPATTTVFRWLDEKPEFRDRYARAKEAQGDLMDQLIFETAMAKPERITVTIGDDATKTGVDNGEVQHRKLRIDALKWRAAHLAPKKYGTQRQEVEHKGKLTLEKLLDSIGEPKKDDE